MGTEYKVLKVSELTRFDDAEGMVRYNRIQFKTKGGAVRTVEIDEKDLTEEKVAAILLKEATKIDKILAL